MEVALLTTVVGTISLASIAVFRKGPAWNLSLATLFITVWIVIGGYFQTTTGVVPSTSRLNGNIKGVLYAGDFGRAWQISAVFVLGILFGVGLYYGSRVHQPNASETKRNKQFPVRRMDHILTISAVVSTLLLVLALGNAGYPTNRDAMAALFDSIPDGDTIIADTLIRSIVQGPPLVTLQIRICRPDLVSRSKVVLAVALWLIWSNPLLEARFWSFGTVASLLLLLLFVHGRSVWKKNANLAIVVLLPIITIIVFPLLDQFRRVEANSQSFEGLEKTMTTDPDFEPFAQLGNAAAAVTKEGHTYGSQISSPLFIGVPRSIWSSKPQDGGTYVSQTLGTEHENVSMPLPGEVFLDFGIPGVLLVGVSLGFALQKLDSALGTVNRSLSWTIIAAGFAPFWIIILRGALLATSNRILPVALIVVILCKGVPIGSALPDLSKRSRSATKMSIQSPILGLKKRQDSAVSLRG